MMYSNILERRHSPNCQKANRVKTLVFLTILWYVSKDPVYLGAGPLPSFAWASLKGFDSEVEVEATKSDQYYRPMLRAFQLSYKAYAGSRRGRL